MNFSKLISAGINKTTLPEDVRLIRATNFIIVILIAAALLIAIMLYAEHGVDITVLLISLGILLCILLIVANKFGYTLFTRISLSVSVSFYTLLISILSKHYNQSAVEVYSYFNPRTFILAISILPFLLLSSKQKTTIYLLAGLNAFSILCFDLIHDLFNVGASDLLDLSNSRYNITVSFYDISNFFIVGALLFFKSSYDKLFSSNQQLLKGMQRTNDDLMGAQDIIDEQKKALESKNAELEKTIERTTNELKDSNVELVKHNNELQQFSNTISHNLRGPVASLLGLVSLFNQDHGEEFKNETIGHIEKSAKSLDTIIRDLNKVIDIRHQHYQIKEQVDINHELDKILLVLDDMIKTSNAKIDVEIKHGNIYCVRSYIHSILYNLVSNALKYRDPDRRCHITIKSEIIKGDIVVSVKDNGTGIDLTRHGKKLFGMYKRFHDQTDGKGLGLFLSKEQVAALGGTIKAESEPGKGSIFIVSIPVVDQNRAEEQIYYESDIGTIYYDATHFVFTLIWHTKPTSEEYRDIFQKNIDVFRTYLATHWIGDVRKSGIISQVDRVWFVENILVEAIDVGVKSIILVKDDDDDKGDDYWVVLKTFCEDHNLAFETYATMEEAIAWKHSILSV